MGHVDFARIREDRELQHDRRAARQQANEISRRAKEMVRTAAVVGEPGTLSPSSSVVMATGKVLLAGQPDPYMRGPVRMSRDNFCLFGIQGPPGG